MKLSILDFGTIYGDLSDVESLQSVLNTVRLADELGFHRFWFTEHHSMSTLLSTAPDLLIAMALAHTKRIRLGAGGIMLPNHSALKVSENFRLLSIAAPDRIDLGLGRAPGTNQQTALALSRSSQVMMHNDFNQQLQELKSFLGSGFPKGHPYASIEMPGRDHHNPNLMMLGSSRGGVEFALAHDLPFVFAGHIGPDLMVEVLKYYNENKTSNLESVAAIGVVCAQTDEQAQYLAEPYILMWVKRMTGSMNLQRDSVEAANAHNYTPLELMHRESILKRVMIGSPQTLETKFKDLMNSTGVEEIMMVDCYPDVESKLEGYRLLSESLLSL